MLTRLTRLTRLTGPKVENGITYLLIFFLTGLNWKDASAPKDIFVEFREYLGREYECGFLNDEAC